MPGKVMELLNIITPDLLATRITERWQEWDNLRRIKKNDWEEIRRYVYATNTTQTSNAKLPWKNKTTVPKLCQIRDNLYSNYTATLFPQRKWLIWEANEKDSNSVAKRDAITNYMSWVIDQPSFKHEIDKIILDYIDYGNCIATVEWVDERVQLADKTQGGYVGPCVRRINPLDIVFNPTSENFQHSPKVIRSLMSIGEVKEMLQRLSNDENRAEYEALFDYLKDIRAMAASFQGDWTQQDNLYNVDGFTSFRAYLQSDFVEVLTFYGDIYDKYNDIFYKNHVITVVDRHKLLGNKPNPSYFGYPPIYHSPWRKKQDNLWGMGPLDNLVGLQYRMDHVENLKADIFDLTTYPVVMVKGFVEDFTWQPGEHIHTDGEGEVSMIVPDVNALNANFEIDKIEARMEQMAGAPREAMGIRTPGEKTKYEVQQLENAASRLYQNKIKQFEEQIIEPLLNAMLEMARRNLTGTTSIKVMDNTTKLADFQTLSVEDILGVGRIKPVAARHFAEQAELIQNLTSMAGSNLWPTIQPHVSGVALSQVVENIFNLEDYQMIHPFIALAEQAEAQKLTNVLQEQVVSTAGAHSGIGGDYSPAAVGQTPPVTPIPQE